MRASPNGALPGLHSLLLERWFWSPLLLALALTLLLSQGTNGYNLKERVCSEHCGDDANCTACCQTCCWDSNDCTNFKDTDGVCFAPAEGSQEESEATDLMSCLKGVGCIRICGGYDECETCCQDCCENDEYCTDFAWSSGSCTLNASTAASGRRTALLTSITGVCTNVDPMSDVTSRSLTDLDLTDEEEDAGLSPAELEARKLERLRAMQALDQDLDKVSGNLNREEEEALKELFKEFDLGPEEQRAAAAEGDSALGRVQMASRVVDGTKRIVGGIRDKAGDLWEKLTSVF